MSFQASHIKTYLNHISPLSDKAFNAFMELFKEERFCKGDFFAQEGIREQQFGILTEGVARAFFRNAKGTEYNKFFNVPISFIGAYSSLVTGNVNLIDIQCLTDCHILTADYQALKELYKTFPEIESFSRRLAELYFVAKEKREIELVLLNAQERYDIFQQEYPELEQQIPQYHIASYLGVTPTQLSRIRRTAQEQSISLHR